MYFLYNSSFSWPSIFCRAHISILHLHIYFTISFSVPALYNMGKFQLAILISLILSHFPVRTHSIRQYRSHNLSSLTASIFTATGCRPVAHPQIGRPIHRIYNPSGRVAQLYRGYRLQWDYSFSRSSHWA